MSITKRLAVLMNGTIDVESEINKGSVFTVKIPQKTAGSAVCGSALSEKLRNMSFHNTNVSKKSQFLREYMPYGSVLVVDDVESNLYVAKGMLLPYGLTIDTASSGFDAIEKIKSGCEYDLIFMDHMMPKMDGIETVKLIREMGYKQSIVALTANALVGQSDVFLQSGFNGFISKPIDSRELNLLLNDFIRNKKPLEVVEEARQKRREKDQIFAGSAEKITEMQKFFIHDAQNAINVFETLFPKIKELNKEENDLLITTVHGLKSAFLNVGEKELSALALKLEKAGIENDLSVFIKDIPGLINSLKFLIQKFKPEEYNVEVSEEDYVFLKEKLISIKASCNDFHINDARETLGELKQKKWPLNVKNLLDDLSVNLLHSAFKKVSGRIDGFIDELSL